jgi:integrase
VIVEDQWMRRGPDGRKRRTTRYGTGLRWRARWRDDDGREKAKSFRTRDAAQAHLDEVAERVGRPVVKAGTVGEWLTVWWATKQRLAETTKADYESLWTQHVDPRWGSVDAAAVKHSEVLAWAHGLGVSTSRANRALLVLQQALALAVKDGALPANPADGARIKAGPGRDPVFLDRAEIGRLLEAAERHHAMVHLEVTTGPRWGEVAGFQVGDLDARRRRLRVRRTLSTLSGHLVAKAYPKGRKRRDLPLTKTLAAELEELACGRAKTEPLFVTSKGNPWLHSSWEREWDLVKERAGLDAGFRFHDLRHTAASLAIASGADVKQVQLMLGHESATMTLDLYGHLWNDKLDDVADRVEALLGEGEGT